MNHVKKILLSSTILLAPSLHAGESEQKGLAAQQHKKADAALSQRPVLSVTSYSAERDEKELCAFYVAAGYKAYEDGSFEVPDSMTFYIGRHQQRIVGVVTADVEHGSAYLASLLSYPRGRGYGAELCRSVVEGLLENPAIRELRWDVDCSGPAKFYLKLLQGYSPSARLATKVTKTTTVKSISGVINGRPFDAMAVALHADKDKRDGRIDFNVNVKKRNLCEIG